MSCIHCLPPTATTEEVLDAVLGRDHERALVAAAALDLLAEPDRKAARERYRDLMRRWPRGMTHLLREEVQRIVSERR